MLGGGVGGLGQPTYGKFHKFFAFTLWRLPFETMNYVETYWLWFVIVAIAIAILYSLQKCSLSFYVMIGSLQVLDLWQILFTDFLSFYVMIGSLQVLDKGRFYG